MTRAALLLVALAAAVPGCAGAAPRFEAVGSIEIEGRTESAPPPTPEDTQ